MNKVHITIDGIALAVDEGKTLMQAAEEADIYIPHLCHHPLLPDIGACRLCIVEIDGKDGVHTSCTTKAENGMVIRSKTEKLNKMRRLNMELMLSNHIEDCTTCPKYSNCELQSLYQYLGVTVGRLKPTLHSVPVNTENPLFVRDLNRCVSCGRCVRVCKDVRGVGALDYEKTESGRVQVDVKKHDLLKDADCRFCGACVEVCPTGALQDKEGVFRKDLKRDLSMVPCQAECPANIDVPRYVRYIKEEKYQDAVAVIREKAPFPHSLGHICMAFCEKGCRRGGVNEALSIRELKRFASSQDEGLWREKSLQKQDTGKRIAIVGAGPAGLTSAFYLRKAGHDVTVFEKLPTPGGMLAYGIPEYRLPREVVAREVGEIERIGVKIKTNVTVNSVNELKAQGFDAVLFAIGTGMGVRLPIDGAEAENVYTNIDFLQKAALGTPLPIGDKVVVLGGGNVAFDCALTALNLGAKEVSLACLESREKMTASKDEIEEGEQRGVQIFNSRTFLAVTTEENKATGVKCQIVDSFSFDENKRLQLQIQPDSEHIVAADTVIFAAGQRPEIQEGFDMPLGRGNTIMTVDGVRVNAEHVYAVGDATYGTHSVIKAIAEARKAAHLIDIDLGGDGNIEEKLAEASNPSPFIGVSKGFADMERIYDCSESQNACQESSRCLQCDLRLQIEKPRLWASYAVK
ncbi:FAD-dependent oxidoreductase [Anaerotignum propionicum]|uniref:FAD-dependent oxidoreductase n=1 Tax=Anaerotignum propionicum TaxID=28446 RepID=UPI00210CE699|nr:FAD-dependent oxidoreductase [Anaerotignum propionicum]MCQ4935692.1 FAD-dependent oxidoreductase [Anaerotignum propionicum]